MRLVMFQPNAHRVYWGWYKYLARQHDFFLVVPEGTGTVPFLKERVIHLPVRRTLFGHFIFLKGVSELLERLKPEGVISKIASEPYSIEALSWAKKNKRPFYLVEEQQDLPIGCLERLVSRPFFAGLWRFFRETGVIAVTRNAEAFLRRKGLRVTYVPVSYYGPVVRRKPARDLRVLYVGRLTGIKNVRALLEAVKKAGVNQCTIVGDGKERESLESFASRLGVKARFTGWVNHDSLGRIYSEHNVFVLPSNPEPIGQVVLEAMAHGLAIICSRKAGAQSYVKEGANGYRCEPTGEAIARRLRLLSDNERRKKFCRASQKLLKEEHGVNRVGKLLERFMSRRVVHNP